MRWWISCVKFTVEVETGQDRRIIKAAPICRKFVGQPLDNLLRWAARFGGLRYQDMDKL